MTLSKLSIIIVIAALIYSGVVIFILRKHKNWLITFLQAFCGLLFIISGWVKAIDPMGTGFKLEQYFNEFSAHLEPTWFSFFGPVLTELTLYQNSFSVFMIVLEIVLGVMLLLGSWPKLTAWLFFLIVVFFTLLTGFTYLTGYVPMDSTFFQFSKWVAYDETNMRVTDCGCFGDFMKLKPKISFFKDLVLLVPAIIFIFGYTKFHTLLSPKIRLAIVTLTTLGTLYYCLSNYVWDLPDVDFRPFKEGVNIRERKQAEQAAMANVPITIKLQETATGKFVEIPMEQYSGDYASEKYKFIAQIKGEPEIEHTKISDFTFYDDDGNDASADALAHQGDQLMIVCYKLYADEEYTEVIVQDTLWRLDSLMIGDSLGTSKSVESIAEKKESVINFTWDTDYMQKFDKLIPFIQEAQKEGVRSFILAGSAGLEKRNAFKAKLGLEIPIYEADDILLKTIIRSNPGVVWMKDGQVVKHWHIKQLPDYVKAKTIAGK